MALPPGPTVNSLNFFEENGYFSGDCAAIGDLVVNQEKEGNGESPSSLDIAKPILLSHAGARPILEPYLSRLDIRLCIALGADPNHCFIFALESGEKDRIIIHLWGPGSQGEVYEGSQVDAPGQQMTAASASNGLLEPAVAALKKRGNSPVSVRMPNGGITITDRRMAFRVIEGSTITFDLRRHLP